MTLRLVVRMGLSIMLLSLAGCGRTASPGGSATGGTSASNGTGGGTGTGSAMGSTGGNGSGGATGVASGGMTGGAIGGMAGGDAATPDAGGSDAGTDSAGTDSAGTDSAGTDSPRTDGGGACVCTQSPAPTALTTSFDCLCGARPQVCQSTAATALAAAQTNTSLCYARAEYAGCGLTALHSIFEIHGGWSTEAFDRTTGMLVGVQYVGDTMAFCPVGPVEGPTTFTTVFRAGRLPDCEATSCEMFGNCSISANVPPPCRR